MKMTNLPIIFLECPGNCCTKTYIIYLMKKPFEGAPISQNDPKLLLNK